MSTRHGSLSLQEIKRLQGGEMILNGFDNDEIADALGVSLSSVRNWRRKLKEHNDELHVLVRKSGSGYTSKLTEEQKQEVKDIVLAGAQAFGFSDERWTGNRVAEMIRQTFKIAYSRSAATDLMHALGLSPQMPVVKSHKHSDEEVLRWIEQEWKRIKKKAKKLGIPVVLVDEGGFSLCPIRGTTWAPVGEPVVLRETFSRHMQTGLGFISMTPKWQRLNFRFTIVDGAITMLDLNMFLTQIHRYYGCKVMILWDRLPAHIASQMYFERERPDWFLFAYFPAYSPELNPVEQCWNMMKNVLMANFVPKNVEELVQRTLEAAQCINADPKLLASFFHHAKLKL